MAFLFVSLPSTSLLPLTSSPRPRRQHRHAVVRTGDLAVAESASALSSFWRWLSDNGAVNSSQTVVKPAVVPEGLGLVAQCDIQKHGTVVEIPKKLWIDADTVAESEIGRVCGGLKPWAAIALFILREKSLQEASRWLPYVNILPAATDSTIFWSEEELAEIRGTQLMNTTLGVKEYVQSELEQIENEVINPNRDLFPEKIELDDFLWAFGILRSRAFSRLRGENLAIIPMADLVNHSGAINMEDASYEIKGKGLFGRDLVFSLRTPLPVQSGEQVYIQYDLKKSNAELALDYGFIETGLNRETYTLTLEISESDPFYEDKLDIAELNGLGETAYFDIVLGHPLPPSMLPYLRLVALGGTDAFLLESIFRNSVWDHLQLPVSRQNEETICRVTRDACRVALSAYTTSIEEDEEMMRKGNLEPRLQIAVGIRAGEKKVLQQIDGDFKQRELELDSLEYYQERRLRDLGLCGENGEIIFWESQ